MIADRGGSVQDTTWGESGVCVGYSTGVSCADIARLNSLNGRVPAPKTIIVMSSERYDFLVHAAERGHIWKAVLERIEAGARGKDAREVVQDLADEFGVSL